MFYIFFFYVKFNSHSFPCIHIDFLIFSHIISESKYTFAQFYILTVINMYKHTSWFSSYMLVPYLSSKYNLSYICMYVVPVIWTTLITTIQDIFDSCGQGFCCNLSVSEERGSERYQWQNGKKGGNYPYRILPNLLITPWF